MVQEPGYILDVLSGVLTRLGCDMAEDVKAGWRKSGLREVATEAPIERAAG
jgi:hypothetical protein